MSFNELVMSCPGNENMLYLLGQFPLLTSLTAEPYLQTS